MYSVACCTYLQFCISNAKLQASNCPIAFTRPPIAGHTRVMQPPHGDRVLAAESLSNATVGYTQTLLGSRTNKLGVR